jgi:hypothetical protein
MQLHEKIMMTAEILGGSLTSAAAEAMEATLREYDPKLVDAALKRCAKELKGRMSLRDILERIPGQHVGAEEAWAIAQRANDEGDSVVWTDEIAEAYGQCRDVDDKVAQRMAFKQAYERIVAESPSRMPKWWVTHGHDPTRRAAAIRQGVERGLLPASSADEIPHLLQASTRPQGPLRLQSGEQNLEPVQEIIRQLEGKR